MQPDQYVTATLPYPPSYLILSHSRKEIILYKYWIFLRFCDPKLRDLANLWYYKLIMR